jgi:hypothetical protein
MFEHHLQLCFSQLLLCAVENKQTEMHYIGIDSDLIWLTLSGTVTMSAFDAMICCTLIEIACISQMVLVFQLKHG